MNNRFFQPRRCGGVEGLWGAAMAATAAQGPTAGAARVGKCLFVASLNKWHTALSFPEVCSFIPAWLLFQASCMRSFSFLPATAILLRGLVRRETEKTLDSPRLPRNLKICKEERKKRYLTNIPPPPPNSNLYRGLCYFYFFSTISLLRLVVENGWAVSSTARRT